MRRESIHVIISFFILVLGSLESLSQNRVIDFNKTWNVLQTYNNKQTLCYKFTSDTLINDTTFAVLKYSFSEKFDSINVKLAGYVREDTAKKRVYLRFVTGESFMIYNFKPEICDVINLPSFDLASLLSFRVEFSDTFVVEGVKRRRMFLESLDKAIARDQIWVEGIGSTVGLIETGEAQFGKFSSKLLCCHNQSGEVWNSGDGTCYFSNVDPTNNLVFKRSKTDDKPVIMPLDFNAVNLKLRIYTIDGRQVTVRKIKSKSDLSFTNLPSGIYIIEIIDYFDKIYLTKKIKI